MRFVNMLLVVAVLMAQGCAGIERSWEGPVSPVGQAMHQLLENGGQMSLAIVPIAETSLSPEAFKSQGLDIEQWRRGIRAEMTGRAEQECLEKYGKYKKFRIVDRMTLNKILDELAMSAHPEISDETRLKIGSLSGATHLAIYHLFRTPGGGRGGLVDTTSARLVDAQTGQLLASATMTVHE